MRENTGRAISDSMEKPATMNQCVLCRHVKMRRDVCGTYCGIGAEKNDNGFCDGWELYKAKYGS